MCSYCGLTDSLAGLFSGLGYMFLMLGQFVLTTILVSLSYLWKKIK